MGFITGTEKGGKTQAQRWRDFMEVLLLAFALALFLRTFLIGFYRISTGSMAPSLRVGDFVWVSKTAYGVKVPFSNLRLQESLPEKGDLVLFRYPNKPDTVHIKRVVGLPGDHISIKGQQILVNEQPFALDSVPGTEFSDISGSEFMQFYKESNGLRSYSVMFAQNKGEDKVVGPLVVPPGEVFLIGDNRDASDDSRYWGAVPMANIEAKVIGIWFSLDWSRNSRDRGPMVRWNRIRSDL
jgi:signal peptidase I